MPEVKENESRADFLERCIPQLIEEGREQDQATAICASMWEDARSAKAAAEAYEAYQRDPSTARPYEELREELGLTDRVFWTGYTPQPEVSANLLASDICVLPYRDGVSFRRGSFMAALSHGLPIVSTRPRVDVPELVHGENILLVPPDAPVALAEAIARLAQDANLRRRLGEGAARLAQVFTWEKIAEKTKALYEEISNIPERHISCLER